MNVLAVLFALAIAVPSMASAATFGGEVFGAFNSYAMGDVNDGIQANNQNLGTNFDEISGSFTGGLNLKMWANPNWMFSAGWEPLFGNTEDAATGEKWTVDGNSFQFTGAYFWPTTSKAKYGMAAGLGYYSLNGEQDDPANPPAVEIKGSGVGFHFMGMGEWEMSPGFAVNAGAGYRVADVTVDDVTPESSVDYSGFMGRVGLSFYMPNR
jgi:hypothetical protein